MKATKYEKTYSVVKDAIHSTAQVQKVVDILSKQDHPLSCAEIGEILYGEKYHDELWRRSYAATLGQVLKHLVESGFVNIAEQKKELIEIEVEEWAYYDENGNPANIQVYDKEGNEYTIPNPKCIGRCGNMHLKKRKKTITSIIKFYSWVAE